MDIVEDEKIYAVFCHLETKHVGNEYLEETMNMNEDSHTFVKEPTLAAALTICHQFRDHPQFREGLLLKCVESQSEFKFLTHQRLTISFVALF